ncbi:MAG TPA: hypothetical protein EYP29_03140 [Thermoplasmata archaeon]|nr:hypothetical protein [Thermoplasmata archaeon]
MLDSTGLNTEQVLKHCFEYCNRNDVKHVVVASTSGHTGALASEINHNQYNGKFNLVVVTHCKGFREPNKDELEPSNAEKIKKYGGKIHTGTMVFHNINDAFRAKNYLSDLTVVADTLRMMGQGTKVAVEIVLMAADAGLIPVKREVFAIAGTGVGADTGLLILAENSRRALKLKIKDVVIKPKEW